MTNATNQPPGAARLGRAIGIDLGTTNSAAAILTPAADTLLLTTDHLGRKTIPSIVGWEPEASEFTVGYRAWNRRQLTPFPAESVKRNMGSPTPIEIADQQLKPEEISAKILQKLGQDMRDFVQKSPQIEHFEPFLGSKSSKNPQIEVNRAVITVPAYFDAPQIEATRRAGELAGFEVLGLLQEPTAAAMYHAFKHGIGDGNFMVYDLGGGTFDVSIIRCMMGEYQVLAVDGDNFLGGDDFDRALAAEFRRSLSERGYSLELDIAQNDDDRVRFLLLERIAREVKEALTNSEVEYVGRRDIFKDHAGQPVTLDLEVSRAQLNSLIEPLLAPSIDACLRALEQSKKRAGVGLEDIDYLLLVGGSTRVPLVQELIAETFCAPGRSRAEKPLIDEPDTCVALGAAIHAANLGGVEFFDHSGDQSSKFTSTSALGTRNSTQHLVGYISDLNADEAQSAVLLDQSARSIASSELRASAAQSEGSPEESDHENQRFFVDFDAIDLPTPGIHAFNLEIRDESGETRTSFEIALKRLAEDAPFRPTGSALSNPSVLAKDIYLEVTGDGGPLRHLLLERGTSLPTTKNFRFYTADRSGAVLLRLFQNRYPIKALHLAVPPETPLNTPVNLTLKVDAAMSMQAEGDILGEHFSATIEAPDAPQLKDWQQIDALLERAEQVRQKLWGMEESNFARQVDPLIAGIHETARTDPDKLQVLARRLEGALEDYFSQQTRMTPAYPRYAALLNAVKRVVYRGAQESPLGRDAKAWHQHLDELEKRAEDAWQARDHDAWHHVFGQIQATWESLAQDEYLFASKNSPAYTFKLHAGLLRQADSLKTALDDFVLSGDPKTEEMQRREIMRLKADIEDDLEDPLHALDPLASGEELKAELARLVEVAARMDRRMSELATLGLVRR